MAALLRDGGLETNGFEACRVSEQILKEADLILAMTRAQRGLVVELWPPAIHRAFTLREFARLLDQADASVLPASCPAELQSRWRPPNEADYPRHSITTTSSIHSVSATMCVRSHSPRSLLLWMS
jgi:protein-tyrosine-phosphatase